MTTCARGPYQIATEGTDLAEVVVVAAGVRALGGQTTFIIGGGGVL